MIPIYLIIFRGEWSPKEHQRLAGVLFPLPVRSIYPKSECYPSGFSGSPNKPESRAQYLRASFCGSCDFNRYLCLSPKLQSDCPPQQRLTANRHEPEYGAYRSTECAQPTGEQQPHKARHLAIAVAPQSSVVCDSKAHVRKNPLAQVVLLWICVIHRCKT